jgi:Nif-specific regulatory protein
MGTEPGSTDLEKLRLERDLYQRLLELGAQTEPVPFLEEALALVVEIAGAKQAYLELYGASDDSAHGWSIAHGFSGQEVDAVRSHISRGIIAEALSTGQVVDTA